MVQCREKYNAIYKTDAPSGNRHQILFCDQSTNIILANMKLLEIALVFCLIVAIAEASPRERRQRPSPKGKGRPERATKANEQEDEESEGEYFS